MAWRGRGAVFGGVFLFLSLNVLLDPLTIEDIKQAKESFAFTERIDTLEAAIRLDFGIGEREGASHSSDWSSVIQIGEGFPHPEEVGRKGRLIRERLGFDAFFFFNLAQPRRVLRRGSLRPVEVGD